MGFDPVLCLRFFLIVVALFLGLMSGVVWLRRKDAPEATTFALIAAAMAVYTFGYSGEVAQTGIVEARRWLDVEYLALPWFPALWLLAACRQNGIRVRPVLLFFIPVLVFIGHYSNFHDWFYSAPLTLVYRRPFWVLHGPRGPLSLLDNAYFLVAMLAGGWIYLSRLRNASSLFRRQAAVLLLGSQIPTAGYFLYLIGLSPWGLDIAPIFLALTCVLFYYGIFHTGLFDLAPIARALIFNSMRDAVLIVDTQRRLLDFNPAAYALLPNLDKRGIGKEIANLLSANPALASAFGERKMEGEVNLGTQRDPRYFEIRTWPLLSGTKQVGQALIFADVSSQVHLREELRRRAETDPLTGLANRRRFHQALETECVRVSRNHAPLSLLAIDLDYFKGINDRFGHPAGDAVLREVAQRLVGCIRKTDVLARYGGEEFSILLPETRREGALVIAERIRTTIEQNAIVVDENSIEITISIGVASNQPEIRDTDAQILLKEADLALYRAKAAGRNRVEIL